jgi:hypothetical protein
LVPCYFCLSFGFCKVAALRAAGADADGGSGQWATERRQARSRPFRVIKRMAR